MPLISVIIPYFDARAWICDALRSVEEQKCDSLEVIVIDDGSKDAGHEIIENEFPWVQVVRTSHQGASKARNLGTSLARGVFLQYLDADDVLAPGKIKLQLDALVSSHAAVAYGDWQYLREDNAGCTVKAEIVSRRLSDPEIDLFTGSFWSPPAAYLFRRDIVERVGKWNESLEIIQDARFVLDCALAQGSFQYCPGIMAYYRTSRILSLSKRNAREFNQDCLRNACEIEIFWRAHGGLTARRKNALLQVFGHIARGRAGIGDFELFESAFARLRCIEPHYIPRRPISWFIIVFSYLVGYRQTEIIAFYFKKFAALFKR